MEAAIVFVHGLFQGLGHLRDLAFPGPGRVLVLDLLGYGEHARASAPTTMRAQVEHVVAELDRHGVPRATLVGHSVGGAVAMLTAASHPGRVAAVVNVEGNFTLADAFWSSKVAAMAVGEAEAMLAEFRVIRQSGSPGRRLSRRRGVSPGPGRCLTLSPRRQCRLSRRPSLRPLRSPNTSERSKASWMLVFRCTSSRASGPAPGGLSPMCSSAEPRHSRRSRRWGT